MSEFSKKELSATLARITDRLTADYWADDKTGTRAASAAFSGLSRAIRDVRATVYGRAQVAGLPMRALDLLLGGGFVPNEGYYAAGARLLNRGVVFLGGTVGTGKSASGVAILLDSIHAEAVLYHRRNLQLIGLEYSLASAHRSARYHTAIRYAHAAQLAGTAEWKEEFIEAERAPLLMVDDLGIESAHGRGKIERILCTRYDQSLQTICASNLTGAQIRDTYGERVYSRLCHEAATVTFTAKLRPTQKRSAKGATSE
jgi:hypothetical protein